VAEQEDQGAGRHRLVRRLVALPPGEERPYVEDEWRDTLIVIARGDLELRCDAGGRRRFHTGDILWAEGLGLRGIVNPGRAETVLITVTRRRPDPPAPGRRRLLDE
jgi:hypothetical protein